MPVAGYGGCRHGPGVLLGLVWSSLTIGLIFGLDSRIGPFLGTYVICFFLFRYNLFTAFNRKKWALSQFKYLGCCV